MSKVYIELQRVQTWLFAVPRLRAMVGANALLGEVLRIRLPALAREQSSWKLVGEPSGYPSKAADDPISEYDDPASDARDGILAHDGGHFEACFASGAVAFARRASALLQRELPGIRFRVSVDETSQDAASLTNISNELPVFSPCEWTGRGLASVDIRQGNESASVSLDVSRRHEAATRAQKGNAHDLASLLTATTRLKEIPRAATFQELAKGSYLALIHADGNGVGSAAAGLSDVERAIFFHRNRVLLRRALRTAVDCACENAEIVPVLPLMLGGDDLLVIGRAEAALPFVVKLCEELDSIQRGDAAGFKLTLGVGVVLAPPTIPINRLHDVAERLAASAKRRFRGLSESDRRSVVDWAVYTTSWVDDPEEVRRRDWVRSTSDTTRVLSRRPVDALGAGLDSLQGLLLAAARIEDAPRSQLRYLVEQLPRGQRLSELAFAELSPEARKPLQKAGIQRAWIATDGGTQVTSLLDIVEILEIGRLGEHGTINGRTVGANSIAAQSPEAGHVES